MLEARFVIVGGGPAAAPDAVAALLGEHRRARRCETVAAAIGALTESWDWDGIILCLDSVGEQGLAWLERLRGDGCPVPALVVASEARSDDLRRVQHLHALFLQAPVDRASVEAFAGFAARMSAADGARLERLLRHVRLGCRLSSREMEILRLVCSGIPRADLHRWLPIKESSIKTHVRSLLRKCGKKGVGDLVAMIHRALFAAGRSTPYRMPATEALAS